MSEDINVKLVDNGFSTTNTVYLKKTRDTHVKIKAFHIPNKKENGAIHHYNIDLSIWKRKIGTNDFVPFMHEDKDFDDATSKSIKIQDKDTINNLLNFLLAQHKLIGLNIDNEFVISDKKEFLEISDIKAQLSSMNLSTEDLNSLNGIVNLKKYSEAQAALNKLVDYISTDTNTFLDYVKSDPETCKYEANQKEKIFQNWIENNLWVFGTSYIRKLDITKLSFSSDSDIVMETLDGFYELIELKLPSVQLFNFDKSHNSYYPSVELSKAISQVLKYLQDVADYKLNIEKENNTKILFPKAKLIIGLESKCESEQEALRRLNASLNNIEILTYDRLLQNTNKLIDFYKINENVN